MPTPTETFQGTDRFQVLRYIGAGGMGAVYEVLDVSRAARVALKVLPRISPDALYSFKQEFRSLAGIAHPNLATLYELHSASGSETDPGQWFFTMEYVEGVDFLSYVRGRPAAPKLGDDGITRTLLENTPSDSLPFDAHGELEAAADPVALRTSLAQLVKAVDVLHSASKLHRDLKPSNVLVTASGRVVVLDFGLVADFGDPSAEASGAGTLAYMSPEQRRGDRLTPASDWYAVGVMLYKALARRSPFGSSRSDRIAVQQAAEPVLPSSIAGDVPPDLEALCMAMLRHDPSQRPSAREIQNALAESSERAPAPAGTPDAPFAGREKHLAVLEEMFDAAQKGHTSLVLLHGASGIGKSALVSEYLMRKRRMPGVVVLEGRCYEQESVPYKTLDSLLDSLSRHLKQLPNDAALALLPRHAAALGRIFPVLRRVPAIETAPARTLEDVDAYELRRLAFGALGELFGRLADRCQLILFIDDLQWGDPDGTQRLMDILGSPDAPRLLLIVSFRDEDAAGNECVSEIQRAAAGAKFPIRDLPVGPLTSEEAKGLVRQLLGGSRRGDAIVDEAAGNPYLLQELIRRSRENRDASVSASLDTVLRERVFSLELDARRLLEVVAISDRPLKYAVACRVAGFESQDPQVLTLLRAGHFIRGAGEVREDQVETYHAHIRATVVSMLDAGVIRGHHLRLAETLASEAGDPESIAVHFEGAGDRARACRYFQAAADRADVMLAFRHAAGLLKRALEQSDAEGPDRRALATRVADAVAKTGFSAEAANRYRELAAQASGVELLELDQKSAYCYAISGHIDEGKAAFRRILTKVGLELPETPGQAIRAVILARLRLGVRGIRFQQHDTAQISDAVLRRVDIAWSAATALTMVDLIGSSSFTTRHLLHALDAGEPNRIVRGLVWEAVVRGTTTEDRAKADRLLEAATRIAQPLADPYTRGILETGIAFNHCSHGRWRTGLTHFDQATEIFSRGCPDATWELSTIRNIRLFALYSFGDWPEMAAAAHAAVEDARERGDLYSLTLIGGSVEPLVSMIADRPEDGLHAAARALRAWTSHGFHWLHIQSLRSTLWVKLYSGDFEGAWNDLEQIWPDLEKHYALQSEWDRIGFWEIRGRCALGMLRFHQGSAKHRRVLKQALRQLKRERGPYGIAMSRVCEISAALLEKDTARALDYLDRATNDVGAFDNPPARAAVRRSLGMLLANERGRAMVAVADQELRRWGVRNPARFSNALIPVNSSSTTAGAGGTP